MPQQSTEYDANLNLGLLLVGEPGDGKTRTALAFRSLSDESALPYLIDFDNNLGSAIRKLDPRPDFLYDVASKADDGSEVPLPLRWELLEKRLKAAVLNPKVGAIIIDSLDPLCDALIAHICRKQGVPEMRIKDWGSFKTMLKTLVMFLRASSKITVITTHQGAEKDEVTGAITYNPTMPGSLKYNFGGFFTDVWACEAKSVGQSLKYLIHPLPKVRSVKLKNSFGLDKPLEVTDMRPAQVWNLIKSQLTK